MLGDHRGFPPCGGGSIPPTTGSGGESGDGGGGGSGDGGGPKEGGELYVMQAELSMGGDP